MSNGRFFRCSPLTALLQLWILPEHFATRHFSP
jgi:hypothetical protein